MNRPLGNPAPDVDVVLGGRYRLLYRIAGGGMGDVWCASDESLGRVVALKILRREYADDTTFLQRFRAEARHTAALVHPGIATVYDYSDGSRDEVGQPFLVMELVPGEPLAQVLEREGALGERRTLDVIGQAALALQAAHDAGVVHRDVKPGNLLLTPEGQVKVSDFGISRAQGSVPLTQTGAIMGTAFYLSPEQASGQSVTPASDLYSLGVVAYECLSGRKPFVGDTPVSVALAQVRDDVPALPDHIDPRVRRLVLRLLAKDPTERPSSAGEVGRAALALRDVIHLHEGGGDQPTAVLAAGGPAAHPRRGLSSDTDPGFMLPPPDRQRPWAPYAVVLLALAVLVAVTAYACARPDDTTAQPAAHGSPRPVGTVSAVTPSAPAPSPGASLVAPGPASQKHARRTGARHGRGHGHGAGKGHGRPKDRR